jgi:flagellar biosynthesis protein FliQ
MDEGMVMRLGSQAMKTALYIAGPILGLGLITGIAVSVFQAVTQIQEMTLTFIPKIVVVMLAIVIFGPWMLHIMCEFTASMLSALPTLPR